MIMAVATGTSAVSTPMKITPPAMPKMPDRKLVASTVTRMMEAASDVMALA